MLKSRALLVSAMSLVLITSACSADKGASPTTTAIRSSVSAVAPSVTTVKTAAAATTVTVPLATVLPTVATTTATTATTAGAAGAAPVAKPSTTSSTTKDYEVVGGIFTTKPAAQSQIDKLTAAKFSGFSIKAVGAKFAAVLPGLTNAEATAMATKINTAGVATATTFRLTSTSTPTASTTAAGTSSSTNYEVVAGIYTAKTAAQAKIDKLTKAKFTGFTIKPITGKFAVVHVGLTKAEASALVTKIDAAGLGPSRIKAL